MTVYIQVNEPNAHYATFSGMSQAAVTAMLDARSKTYTVKTRTDWETVCPQGDAIYVMAGQSNMVNLGTQQGTNFLAAMGDEHSSYINPSVSSTPMSRWMVGGDLYNTMLSGITSAKAAKASPYIAGLIFWQGESDVAEGLSSVNAWPQRFTDMVAGFRAAINDPKRRVVFAQVTDTGVANRTTFRNLQAGISITNVSMISSDGIVQVGDHTDAAGYAIMMNRFVTALKTIG